MALVEELKAIQGDLHDEAFAAQLGMSGAAWRNIKSRQRLLGRIRLRNILLAYPELESDVLDYIRQTETELQSQQVAVGG